MHVGSPATQCDLPSIPACLLVSRKSQIIMWLQRLRWLLPALIVSWLNLQLGAALPAHDERLHVSAFDPSAATSSIIREDYNKRTHPPGGKNNTQPSHKLVPSPAGLLRPDKFQFYTYNDKGDMITRQMTVQEIQGLIAAGGADHIAMDRQEPQKADDVLTGGKKVMDVVQKVQNVLKSALDKPPTLTGSIPKIPEHANVEWSNILPSILSGEADAISPSSESDQLSLKHTTEKIKGSGVVSSTESSSNIGMTTVSKNPTRKPVMPDIQTNAYAGFTNNLQKPHHSHHAQQTAGAISEKPMIPVPVITLTEQKLSTLQSTVTESPVFQMLSVIPVEATESAHKKGQTESSAVAPSAATVRVPPQTAGSGQGEQFVELTLSKVPESTTVSQLSSTKQTIANLNNKIGQVSTIYYSMTPGTSAESSTAAGKETVTHNEPSEVTNIADKTSSSNATYVLIPSKNNTGLSEDVSLAPDVTKESQVNGTRDDEVVPQTNATALGPLSHASRKPIGVTNKIASSSSTLASASGIEATTGSTSLLMDRLGEDSPMVTKESLSSVTATYTEHHLNPQSTESLMPMEPLPTQLIDSFSSVMSQVSEVKPSVLSLSPTLDGAPQIPIMNINYGQRHSNVSDPDKIGTNANTDLQQDRLTSHDAVMDENTTERTASSQTYAAVTKTTRAPLQDITTRIIDSPTTQRSTMAAMDITKSGINNSSANSQITVITSTASTVVEAISNKVTGSNAVTTSAGLNTSPDTSQSTTHPSVPLEKTQNASLEKDHTKTAADAALEKHVTDKITSVKVPVTFTILDVNKTQSTTASSDASESSSNTLTNGYLDNTLTNLNWSNPVSAIDQVLNVAPLPPNMPSIESIALPNDTSKLAASVLASSLIAGFTTSTSERSPIEEINKNQVTKNASTQSTHTVRPTISSNVTKLAGSTENVTQMYEKNAEHIVNEEYQKKKNITHVQASMQRPALTDPAGNDALKLTGTKESNNASQSTKLKNDNEKMGDSTKGSLSPTPNRFANVSDEKHDTAQNVSVGAVTMNLGQLSTMNDTQSNVNKTLDASFNQNKKGDKIKTTEAPIRTDVSPQSPVKIVLIDSINTNDRNSVNISGHVKNSSKIEALDKNNGSINVSSATKEVIEVHSANESKSELHSHKNNITKNSTASNSPLHATILPDRNSTNSAFAQNSKINNAAVYKHKDNTSMSHTAINNHTAVTSRTPVQNNEDDNESTSSSSLSMQKDSPVHKDVNKLNNTSGNKEQLSRPIFVNGTNNLSSANNTSNQNNKDTLLQQTIPMNNASIFESSAKNTSAQTHSQLNNTESKPASLKHSETSPKPEVIRLQLSTLPPTIPIRQTPKPTITHKPLEKSDASKTDTVKDSNVENKWTLISQQVPPGPMTKVPKPPKIPKPTRKPVSSGQTPSSNVDENNNVRSPGAETATHQQDESSAQSILPLGASQSANGLDISTRYTSADIVNFAKLCNELALNFWVATNKGLSTARSLALSPFGMTSLLAMIFLGARGPTSDQMNEVLRLDDVATFNPHLVFQNITDTVSLARGQGIANAAFVRELFADKMKVRKLMPFYKEQAQQFYEGLVTEVNFATISDLVRRRTNLLIRKQTGGRIKDFVKTNTVPLRSPLAALSANVFQTDCNSTLTSSIGRDGELYFAVSPAVRQRKLVPVPATTWRSGVLAGYEPSIDATAVALGGSDKLVSTIFVLPGQQGHTAPGDTLDRLEQRLVRNAFRDGAWNKLLKVLIPRSGLELQVPKFSHRSVVNATAALKRMGLDELFSGNADFKGINGVGHRLHLADVLQMNLFSTCGDENILGGRHHVETYPASPLRRNVRRQMENTDNFAEDDTSKHSGVSPQEDYINSFYADQLHTARGEIEFYRESRQLPRASLERPRLKLDRPFLYFVRHNPSGIILHMGRFNPRLLP
ncbi:hypothetical protein DMN91_007677 [Ooceraea biroi]|uniref:Serpin domain-containing protein n=2 Tax=Ooceraea biroi TaxID=2015173 RepID=A0A3L8DL10_OOCBI|nr:bromodomain-containing protein DDB_G0270170 isoform X1 [Ooceraea biroi]RLU21061.1 hypothetical protein DMN91_007677 [Ooceraea biroi]